jgi:hypothetical protein
MTKVKLLGKKVKNQRVKVMISNERSCQKNTHLKYESPTAYQSKVMTKVKVFKRRSNSKVNGQRGSRSWYQMKVLARRNTHVKYESPGSRRFGTW